MKNLDNIFSLDEKVIVVTGASGLLGRMHVEAIAHQGGTPIIVDINNVIGNAILIYHGIERI